MISKQPTRRTAVITGATSLHGIGRITALRLAAEGWSIGIIDRDDLECREFAKDLRSQFSVDAVGIAADVSNGRAVEQAIGRIVQELPQIVALANIAGVSSAVPYFDVDEDEWNRVIGTNLTGTHFVSQSVARVMSHHGYGRIVNMSSVSAQRGGGTYSKTPYSVSKAGVIGLTRALARELGAYNITVNAIAPGPVDTDIMGGALDTERREALASEQFIHRVVTRAEVAAAISYLFSDDAALITGQTININGGLYMS